MKCKSTSGFLTVITLPSLETSVADFSAGVVSVVGFVTTASVVFASVTLGCTCSVTGCDTVVVSSAYAGVANIVNTAAERMNPHSPYALDFFKPSLIFLVMKYPLSFI